MPMRINFSVIIPCYNALEGLKRTIESVRTQNCDLWECLIVDGASTDGTAAWLMKQRDPFIHWISEADGGVYDAMNKGIKMAKGEFLIFLGAGDALLPGALSSAADFIHKLPTKLLRFVYGNVRWIDEGGRIGEGEFTAKRLCRRNICHQAIFYEKGIFDRWGGYEQKYPIYADWAFNLRCFGDERIARFYWDKAVADFIGGGLSARQTDYAFAVDHISLIRERIGFLAASRVWMSHLLGRICRRIRRVGKLTKVEK